MRKAFLILLLILALDLVACGPQSETPSPTLTGIPTLPLMPATPTRGPAFSFTPTPAPTLLNSATPAQVTPTPGGIQNIVRIAMFDESIGWALAGQPPQLVRTTDGGATWRDVTPNPAFDLQGVFFLDERLAWVPAVSGVSRTVDGGRSWVSAPAPFKNAQLQFCDPNTGIALADPVCGAGTCYVSLYYTADGGQSWSLLPLSSSSGSETVPSSIPSGAAHILSGDTFKLTAPATLWMGGNGQVTGPEAVLLVSRDGGKVWSTQRILLPEAWADTSLPNRVELPVFFNPNDGFFTVRYYLQGSGGAQVGLSVYATHDAGRTWEILPGIVQGVPWDGHVSFLSQQEAIVRCGETLCVTRDGGHSWAASNANLPFSNQAESSLQALDFASLASGWAFIMEPAGGQTLYRTRDGGQTWKALRLTLLPK
jgi:photosystem II stability/assembly factor-like uncharacterized protein